MLGHGQRNRINKFQNAERDHKAPDGGVGRVVARVSDLFDHRVLRVLAVPSVSETNNSEDYSHERSGEKLSAVSLAVCQLQWLLRLCSSVSAFIKPRI